MVVSLRNAGRTGTVLTTLRGDPKIVSIVLDAFARVLGN